MKTISRSWSWLALCCSLAVLAACGGAPGGSGGGGGGSVTVTLPSGVGDKVESVAVSFPFPTHCYDDWVTLDSRLTVHTDGSDISVSFNPSCGFLYSQSFSMGQITCKVESGMCSSFGTKGKMTVTCQDESGGSAIGVANFACKGDSNAECGSTSCWDNCTSSYLKMPGNSCTNEWDFQRSCYTAKSECR